MKTKRSVVWACAFGIGLAAAPHARAAGPGAPHAATSASASASAEAKPDLGEPEAVAKERARSLFDKGVSAYREARYYDAVDIFLETNRLYPDPKLSFNVGKAYEGLGNLAGALRYYREYLRRVPDASDAKDVDSHVRQLEQTLSQKGIQQLTVISTPEGATLKIDGQAVGITPWTGETFAGKHRMVLELSGYLPSQRVVEVDLHHAQDFTFELGLEPKPPAAKPLPPAPVPEPRMSVFTLSTLASGIALLGTALIVQAAGSSNATGISRTSAVFAGAGGGVSVLGGLMLYFDLNPTHGSATSGIVWDDHGLEHGTR